MNDTQKIQCNYKELVPLQNLVSHPDNNNQHSIEQIEMLSKIIQYQGMRAPIVVSNRSGFITKGHARKMALEKLGWETAPVEFQDYESEAQEYADLTADNEIARWSKLDMHGLYTKLDDLKTKGDIDIDMFGIEDFKETPWDSNIGSVDGVEENLDGLEGKIKITCPMDLKDEVLIYIKAKLLETSFEGVHVE